MQKTDADLLTEKNVIKNETALKANTATRVGTMIENVIDSKINNDKIETANNLATPGKSVAGRDAVKAYVDAGLATKLDASSYNDRFKGKYLTLVALQTAHPTASVGDYAQVNEVGSNTVKNYNWDDEAGDWILGGDGASIANTDELTEGSTNLYHTAARVLGSVIGDLTGLVTNVAISAGDTTKQALGKLQGQVNALIAEVALKLNKTDRTFSMKFSDMVTPIVTGTNKVSVPFPYDIANIQEMWIGLDTPQSSGAILTIDVNKNGVTMLSTKITVDNGESSSLTAAIQPVISVLNISKGDKISVDVDQVGNGTAISGTLCIRG